MTGGTTLVSYMDPDTLANDITNYTFGKLGSADADNLLETSELFEIKVDISTYSLTNDDEFTINITPASGAVLTIGRTTPAQTNTRMSLR